MPINDHGRLSFPPGTVRLEKPKPGDVRELPDGSFDVTYRLTRVPNMTGYTRTAQRLVDDLLSRCEWDEDENRLTYQSIDVTRIAEAIERHVADFRARAIARLTSGEFCRRADHVQSACDCERIAAAIRELE